jgi:uncharacterized protein (DUF2236 family)
MTTHVAPVVAFGSDSIIRRVHSEGVLLLGGGRALLMQLAHPLIARGVAEHSSFRRERLRRLLRTLRPMLAIAYGTPAQVAEAAASVNATHDYVHGAGYDAHDPELLLWVLATLIDTTLTMQRLFVRPLTPEEEAAYYRETRRVGEVLGLPESYGPPDLPAFEAYMRDQCDSLRVSNDAREIAHDLFRYWPPPWALMWPMRQLTAGLLPPELRLQYGMSWGLRRQRLVDVACAASRLLLPRIPMTFRKIPAFLMPPKP